MRLLLDEHLSPTLVERLSELGIFAQSVPHVGMAGASDGEIWQFAFAHDFAVVTTNARDFIELLDIDVHGGLIVLRESGLTREEQWARLKPVLEYLISLEDEDCMVNKLVEITAQGKYKIRQIPAEL